MKQSNNSEDNFLDDQEFDHFFKSQLEHHQIKPDQANWSRIKRWNPFRFLFQLSEDTTYQLVASLLFLFTVATIFFHLPLTQQSPLATQHAPNILPSIDTIIQEEKIVTQSDFVLDIADELEAEDLEVRKELIEKELDDYLAFLFEEENEFGSIIDSLEISKYLKPAKQLPIEEMFAVIPELPAQEEITILAPLETRITLPHRFISDEKEIEAYLLLYEINKGQKNQ